MIAARSRTRSRAARQRGAVLFVALIFLLILTLLGVMLARVQTTEERMAQNDGNHELAVEAGEAALRFAESNIAQGVYSVFGNAGGLYMLDPALGSEYTPGYDWAAAVAAGNALTYTGTLASVSQPPQFFVEEMQPVAVQGQSIAVGNGAYNSNGTVTVYQITAHASGGDQTSSATLRSIYVVE